MASDDLKQFLQQRTGVPEARWKRLSKKTGTNGAAVRLFEDRDTGRRVLTQEMGGALSILEDSANVTAGATPGHNGSVSPTAAANDRRFAIVLCEDPSLDDAMEDLLDEDPSFDVSYRWMTTLRLADDASTTDPAVFQALVAALPDYALTPAGTQAAWSCMLFDDVVLVSKDDGTAGFCTCERDRLDVVRRLQAQGWTFDPSLADGYAAPDGQPPARPVGPIVAWRPGMPPPTSQSEALYDRPLRSSLAAMEAHLNTHPDDLRAMMSLMGMLSEDLDSDEMTVFRRGLPVQRQGFDPREPGRLRGPSTVNPATRFGFAFGENPELPIGDWQHEWLEIYDLTDDEGCDDHIEDALVEAGIRLPSGLSEVVEGTFDYRTGDPCWTREDLFPLLLATGMTWSRERCALAASGFDPNQKQGDTPWWRRGP